MDMRRRAMEALGEVNETVARDKPEWTTPNRVVVDLGALRLRDFSFAQESRRPALFVATFALHDAALADLAPGHSLVETLLALSIRDESQQALALYPANGPCH